MPTDSSPTDPSPAQPVPSPAQPVPSPVPAPLPEEALSERVLAALRPVGWAERARGWVPLARGWTAAEVLARVEAGGEIGDGIGGPEVARRRRALARVHGALRGLAAAGRCRRRERRVQADLAGKGQRWVVVEVYWV